MKRLTLLGLGPLAALTAFLLPAALVRGELPARIATHWGIDGTPDGSSSTTAFVLGVVALWSIGWIALTAQLRARETLRLTVAPFAWGVMWFGAALGVAIVLANDGARRWWDADDLSLPLALLPVLAGALGAAAAAWPERDRPATPPTRATDDEAAAPGVGLRAGERAAWSAHVRSRVNTTGAVVAGVALGTGAFVAGGPAAWILGSAALVAVAGLATLSELEASVTERGLTLALGPFGLPRRVVPLAQIATADRVDVDPWRYGGWGYRKLPRRRGGTAIVLRAGEGLRLTLTDGRELVVTVPDASTAAALLRDLRDLRDARVAGSRG